MACPTRAPSASVWSRLPVRVTADGSANTGTPCHLGTCLMVTVCANTFAACSLLSMVSVVSVPSTCVTGLAASITGRSVCISRVHQLSSLLPLREWPDSTRWLSALVMATYRALFSSTKRAAWSVASKSLAHKGGDFSLATNTTRAGVGESLGQSTNMDMLCAFLAGACVSSNTTYCASKPLEPCTVSNLTALAGVGHARLVLALFTALTN